MKTKKYIAEFIGTFALIFCGTGAIIIDQEMNGVISHAGVATVWGLIVAVMIFALGDVSGAHLNPAVTVSFAFAKRFEWKEVPMYIIAQATGAFSGSILLHFLFRTNETLGASLPAGSEMQSFIFEFILTLLLVLVIFNVTTGSKEKGITAALAIGGTVGLEAMFAGPICGASMNPIRSLAPAIISGHTEHLLIYLTAPFLGAITGVILHHFLYPESK